MEKKIYIGIAILFGVLLTISLFGKKRDKVIAKIKEYMVLARIWLHSEDGQAKERWVMEKVIEWISSTGKLPITSKILLFFFNEKFMRNTIKQLAPDVKSTYKPVIQSTLNKVGQVAVETVTQKIVDLGVSKSQDITKMDGLGTKEVIDLANVLKYTKEDKDVISAIASYKTDFEDEKEFVGSIGFARKF